MVLIVPVPGRCWSLLTFTFARKLAYGPFPAIHMHARGFKQYQDTELFVYFISISDFITLNF